MNSKLLNELSPNSAGVKDFLETVRDTKGAVKALGFRRMKDLETYVLDSNYKEFNELKKELKKFLGEETITEQEKIEKLPKIAVSLFRYLDANKKKIKKKSDLFDEVKKILGLLNLNTSMAKYYMELYLANQRPEGDYDKLTGDQIVDPRKRKPWSISNTSAYQYTKSMIPFKGSNLEGYWTEDINYVPVYVVKSYGWYPIFVYKDGKWYESVDRYSSSTARQISNADPSNLEVKWNKDLQTPVYWADQDDLEKLIRSFNHEELIEHKKQKLLKKKDEYTKRASNINLKTYDSVFNDTDYELRSPKKLKYKVKDIELVDGKLVVKVDVIDLMDLVGLKGEKTDKDYTKGEIAGITQKSVEKRIENDLNYKLRSFMGKRPSSYAEVEDSLLKYEFNHLRGNQ